MITYIFLIGDTHPDLNIITIFVGDNIVKTCKDVPALNCRYIVPNVKTTMPRRIYCRATNSEKECRLKFVELEFINATDGKKILPVVCMVKKR